MKRLTYNDRVNIQILSQTGMGPKEVAQRMGVHLATIYREYSRGGKGVHYSAIEAQKNVGAKNDDSSPRE